METMTKTYASESEIISQLEEAGAAWFDGGYTDDIEIKDSVVLFYFQGACYSVRRDWLQFAKHGAEEGVYTNIECQTLGKKVEIHIVG